MRMRSALVMGMPLRSALSTRLSSPITLWTTPKDAMDMGRVAGLSQGLVEYGFQQSLVPVWRVLVSATIASHNGRGRGVCSSTFRATISQAPPAT